MYNAMSGKINIEGIFIEGLVRKRDQREARRAGGYMMIMYRAGNVLAGTIS